MIDQGFHYSIYRRILDGETELPSLPDVMLRIRKALAQPHCHLDELITILQSDPALVGYLLKVADSPLYKQPTPADDLMIALQRIGMNALGTLVLTWSLRHLFVSRSPKVQKLLREAWHLCLHGGAFSAVIARRSRKVAPDRAMLAGLLQNIGYLQMLVELEPWPELFDHPRGVRTLCNEVAADVGLVLGRHWGLSDDTLNVIRHRRDWNYSMPAFDLTACCQLAEYLVLTHNQPSLDLPPIDALPGYCCSLFAQGGLRRHQLLDYLKDDFKNTLESLGGTWEPPLAG